MHNELYTTEYDVENKFIKVITAPIVFIPFLISILLFNWAFSLDKKGSVENEKIC